MSTAAPPSTAASDAVASERGVGGGDEPRIAVLAGDRLCARCAFNLNGQTIVRERHYGLLIARCPECGTPAALQEYPALSRHAGRLAFLSSAAYFLGMLVLVVVGALVMWGTASSLADRLAAPYQAHVTQVWTEYQAEQTRTNPNAAYNPAIAMQWWNGLDRKKLFEDAGGWRRAIAWHALWGSVFAAMALVPFGVVLAVAAPHLRWKGRMVMGVAVGMLGATFWVMQTLSMPIYFMPYMYGWGAWSESSSLRWVLMPLALGVGVACLLAGLWAGRMVARGVVRLLLPPRLRGPMAFLWFVDGKAWPGR